MIQKDKEILVTIEGEKQLAVNFYQDTKADIMLTCSYIKSGEQEIENYVSNVTKPELNDYVANKSVMDIDAYVNSVSKPEIDEHTAAKKEEFNANAVEKQTDIDAKATAAANSASVAADSAISANNSAQAAASSASQASDSKENAQYWAIQAQNFAEMSDASETVRGAVYLATNAEVTEGTDDTKAVTPLKLKGVLDTRLSSVYRYKGTVASSANLPNSANIVGDVWNVSDTGSNYAWDGATWDKLSETIDLSPYAQISDVNAKDAQNVKLSGNQTISGTKTFTAFPKSRIGDFQLGVIPATSATAGGYLIVDKNGATLTQDVCYMMNDGRVIRNTRSYNKTTDGTTVYAGYESVFSNAGAFYLSYAPGTGTISIPDTGNAMPNMNKVNSRINAILNQYDYVTETVVNGTNWYRLWKSGWCEQGGFSTTTSSTESIGTLLKPYKDTNYHVFSLYQSNDTGSAWTCYMYAAPVTTSTFSYGGHKTGNTCHWFAFGKTK